MAGASGILLRTQRRIPRRTRRRRRRMLLQEITAATIIDMVVRSYQ